MKRSIPSILGLIALIAYVLVQFASQKQMSDLDYAGFGTIPVERKNKILTIDSVARHALLEIHGTESIEGPEGRVSAVEWFMEIASGNIESPKRPIFRIINRDILALIRYNKPSTEADEPLLNRALALIPWSSINHSFASYEDLDSYSDKIFSHARTALRYSPQQRNEFENEIIKIARNINTFRSLSNTFSTVDGPSLKEAIDHLEQIATSGIEAVSRRQSGTPYDSKVYKEISDMGFAFQSMEQHAYFNVRTTSEGNIHWLSLGALLKRSITSGTIPREAVFYAELIDDYHNQELSAFNQRLEAEISEIETNQPADYYRSKIELFRNLLTPISGAIFGYALALLPAFITWLRPNRGYRRAAIAVTLGAYTLHSFNLLSVVYLMGVNSLVTNSFDSQFISWIAITISLGLIFKFRSSIAIAATVLVGLTILVFGRLDLIASYGRLISRDNEMLVVHILSNISIASGFVVGSLGGLFIFISLFSNRLIEEKTKQITQMIYFGLCLTTVTTAAALISHCIAEELRTGFFFNWTPVQSSLLMALLWYVIVINCKICNLTKGLGIMSLSTLSSVFAVWTWLGIRMLEIPEVDYGLPSAGLKFVLAFATGHVLLSGMGLLTRNTSSSNP